MNYIIVYGSSNVIIQQTSLLHSTKTQLMAFLSDHTSSVRLLPNDELQASYGDSDEGISSGYDSGDLCDSETEPEVRPIHTNSFLYSDSDTDDDSLTEESDSDDNSDSEFGDDEGDVMRFTSTDNLCDSLTYILSMPELCDVTFLVGPQRLPIHGVKAILGTRSRLLYNMLIKAEKDLEETLKSRAKSRKLKSSKQNQEKPTRLTIDIDTYEPEVFRRIIQFVHSGSVNVDSTSVIGLMCGAEEFGLKDLKMACWDFVTRCSDPQQLLTSSSDQLYPPRLITGVIAKISLNTSETRMKTTRGVNSPSRNSRASTVINSRETTV